MRKTLIIMAVIGISAVLFTGCSHNKDLINSLTQQLKDCQDGATAYKTACAADLDGVKGALDACNKTKAVVELKNAEYKVLADALQAELAVGVLEVAFLAGKVQIRLPETILFSSDGAAVHKKGEEIIGKLADQLKNIQDRLFLIEGHTDNVPVGKNSPFKSNWELSYARAKTVVDLFIKKGIDPSRLGAGAMSEYQPIATNETADGRKKNRRIEIELLPLDPIFAGPAQAAPAPAK